MCAEPPAFPKRTPNRAGLVCMKRAIGERRYRANDENYRRHPCCIYFQKYGEAAAR
jgi:hypothetical protein